MIKLLKEVITVIERQMKAIFSIEVSSMWKTHSGGV